MDYSVARHSGSSHPWWCLVFGGTGGGGLRGQKKVCVPKMGLSFWLSIQNFIFPKEFFDFGCGGGLAGGGGPPDPPPFVDKHIPVPTSAL